MNINTPKFIPLYSTDLSGKELDNISDSVNTGWISSKGKFVSEFEQNFTDILDMKCLATSNGTTALHLALKALGIKDGDHVIVPNYTFISPINAVLYCQAVPIIVDVEYDTGCICPIALKNAITADTKACILVHLYGQCANIRSIKEIIDDSSIYLIEDCAEALGTRYQSQHVGVFSDACTFSFFANKTITTGEGGMVGFKQTNHFEMASLLRDHGMDPNKRYWHENVGYNYRMTNLQAAVGVAQFDRLDSILYKKRLIAKAYNSLLGEYDFIELPTEAISVTNSYWLYTIYIPSITRNQRDLIIKEMLACSIECRPTFYPAHWMPPYSGYSNNRQMTNSINLSNTGISLPSFPALTNVQITYIAERLIEIIIRIK